jgi:hypothetical protein
MTKEKLALILVTGFLALLLDAKALSVCGRVEAPVHVGLAVLGLLLQVLGLWLEVMFLRGTTESRGEEILPADYFRFGLLRSKWTWSAWLVLAGAMMFAGAFTDEFQLGQKFWICQGN